MKRCHRVEFSGCSPRRILHSPRTNFQVCERVRQAALLFIREQHVRPNYRSALSLTAGCDAHPVRLFLHNRLPTEPSTTHAHTVKRSSSKGNLAAVKYSGSTGKANNVCANSDQNESVKNHMSPGSDVIATPTEEVMC